MFVDPIVNLLADDGIFIVAFYMQHVGFTETLRTLRTVTRSAD